MGEQSKQGVQQSLYTITHTYTLILLLSLCMKCDVDALLTILVETGIQLCGVDVLSTMGSRDQTHILVLHNKSFYEQGQCFLTWGAVLSNDPFTGAT